jgi:hypothetical protein
MTPASDQSRDGRDAQRLDAKHASAVAESDAAPLFSENTMTRDSADAVEVTRDWRRIAKLAGEHGIRYRTNAALEKFLSALSATPSTSDAWRCFHCGDVFTTEHCARLHFGRDEDSAPACQIKGGAEQGLLGALRAAEYEASEARRAISDECTEAARAHYAQTTRHDAALRNAEELGYERGLADGRTLATPSPSEAMVERLREAANGMMPKRWFCVDAEAYADDPTIEPIETDAPRRLAEQVFAALTNEVKP